MKKVILLILISSLTLLIAGTPKSVYFHIVDSNGDQFDFSDGNNGVEFEMWNPEREGEILTFESEGASYEMFGGVWSGIVCNVGYFPTPWQPGDKIKAKIKHCVDKGWYEPESGAVIYTLYLPDDDTMPMFFGFEPIIEGSGEPIVLGTFKSDTSIESNIPTGTTMEQNYPNPFNPTTTINFSVANEGLVNLNVYNLSGQIVSKLLEKELNVGMHSVNFDASDLSAGVYYYILEADDQILSNKMILLK